MERAEILGVMNNQGNSGNEGTLVLAHLVILVMSALVAVASGKPKLMSWLIIK